ncbi:hypothetical protein EVAR_3283_1 [Eumeta japonica]|uniref:Uncharacterized protein n=1 Tax=Eumeta variegata TaxID=151549 RepID=A0A4C1SVS2_EUMVA|nr:hypothetical protein EVAR_3283_1 [Eumeta japonica]
MKIEYNSDSSPYVMWGDNKIQLERTPAVEKYYEEKAETELRETPEVVEEAVRELRELLRGLTIDKIDVKVHSVIGSESGTGAGRDSETGNVVEYTTVVGIRIDSGLADMIDEESTFTP